MALRIPPPRQARLAHRSLAPNEANEANDIVNVWTGAFNSLDGRGEDAVAHELQDFCNGHPAATTYRYHIVPN
jgi:hypothetical protein